MLEDDYNPTDLAMSAGSCIGVVAFLVIIWSLFFTGCYLLGKSLMIFHSTL